MVDALLADVVLVPRCRSSSYSANFNTPGVVVASPSRRRDFAPGRDLRFVDDVVAVAVDSLDDDDDDDDDDPSSS